MIQLIIVALLFVAYTVGIGIAFYFVFKKVIDIESESKQINVVTNKTLSELASDVDKILGDTTYDPQKVTSVSSANNTSVFDISTGTVNRLTMGRNGYMTYNGMSETLSLGNTRGNTSIVMQDDTITMNPKVAIGNYNLVPMGNGLHVCTDQGCSPILLGQTTRVV